MTREHDIPMPRQAEQYTETVINLDSLSSEDRQVIDLLYAEADECGTREEREEAIRNITELAGELALSEMIQKQAEEDIQAAKSYKSTRPEISADPGKQALIDTDKIGWLLDQEPFRVPIKRIEGDGSSFWLGSIVKEHRVTQAAYHHLETEGIAETLQNSLTKDAIPKFLDDLQSGNRRLRPINLGSSSNKKQRNLNTTYPAYKLDVQGTSNRAVILLPEKVNDETVIILAALYDHEDQHKVLNVLSILN